MASIEILLDSVTEILRLRQSGHKPSREYIIGGKGQGEGLRGGGGKRGVYCMEETKRERRIEMDGWLENWVRIVHGAYLMSRPFGNTE